jgi:cyclase
MPITAVDLAPDVLLIRGATLDALAVAFFRGDDVLLVNGLASDDDACALRERLGDRVKLRVAIQGTSDHTTGLELFPDAPLIAHELYPDRADIRITGDTRIAWGEVELTLFHAGGHRPHTLGVDVPARDLLLAGDNLIGNLIFLSSSTPEQFRVALQRLQQHRRARIVPGHVDVLPAAALDHAQHYLAQLERATDFDDVDAEAWLPEAVAVTEFERGHHLRNLEILRRTARGGSPHRT